MDNFPDHINLESCIQTIKDKQDEMVRNTRKSFTEQIEQAIDECNLDVNLSFNKKMWDENRLIITKELLKRFKNISIHTSDGVKRNIAEEDNIHNKVVTITILFTINDNS